MRGRVEIVRAGSVLFRDQRTGLRHELRKDDIDRIITEFGSPVRFRAERRSTASRDAQGSAFATLDPSQRNGTLKDRRAQAAAHPAKTWPCEQCAERTRLTESACWNCARPRFPQVDTTSYPGGALTRGGEDPSLVSCEECGAGVGEACRTIRLVGR